MICSNTFREDHRNCTATSNGPKFLRRDQNGYIEVVIRREEPAWQEVLDFLPGALANETPKSFSTRGKHRDPVEHAYDIIVGKMGEVAVANLLRDLTGIRFPIDTQQYPELTRGDNGKDIATCEVDGEVIPLPSSIDVKTSKSGASWLLVDDPSKDRSIDPNAHFFVFVTSEFRDDLTTFRSVDDVFSRFSDLLTIRFKVHGFYRASKMTVRFSKGQRLYRPEQIRVPLKMYAGRVITPEEFWGALHGVIPQGRITLDVDNYALPSMLLFNSDANWRQLLTVYLLPNSIKEATNRLHW